MYSTPGLPSGDARSKSGLPAQNTMAGRRVYQVWKGSNRFFLGGRLIFGPDARSLLATLFLILAPIVVFCIFVGRHLMKDFPNHAGIAIIVVAVVHTCCVLVLLLLTSGRDPGIVPRNKHPPEPEEEGASSSDWSGAQTPRLRLPRTKDVLVNNMPVKVKYCDTCMLYRPPRCSHCSICNNCVERFDHHCPWVGQCIGLRNYPYFFMFVLSATVLCFYIFAMSALRIKKLMEGDAPHTVWKALQRSPASAFLMAYAFLATWFVGGLTMFHLYLISTNQTTYENFRYRYDNKVNPYNQGVLHNFKEVLCSWIPPSKNNFRAKVQQDDPGCIDAKAQQRDNPDLFSPNNNKGTRDVEVGSRSMWTPPLLGSEGAPNLHSRNGSGIKHIYDDVFAEALGKSLPYESSDTRSVQARGSSRGRESGKWDISPELLGLSSGVGGEGSQKVNNVGLDTTKNW